MQWLVLTYSLPTGANSSPRVALWRRLRRLGAITVTGGAYILPAGEECHEAFQWLSQEIRQAQGEALILSVTNVEGLGDAELIELFRSARRIEYAELEAQVAMLEHQIIHDPQKRAAVAEGLERLRRRHAEITRIDYFECPDGRRLAGRLAQIAATLTVPATNPSVSPASLSAYQGRRWVTRPRPHVDRLACIWLIRRFIDPTAVIRFSHEPAPEELSFDMDHAVFRHTGNYCTFETMLHTFGLDDPALRTIAEIVHEIDLCDGQYTHPAIAGIDAVLDGWRHMPLDDAERERLGIPLFEGLYLGLKQQTGYGDY